MRKTLLIALAVLLFPGAEASAQKTSVPHVNRVLIDRSKPAVYLDFVKTGVCHNGNYFTSISVGPCERKSESDLEFQAAWIRFVNNTRWAMMIDVQKISINAVVPGYKLANGSQTTAAKANAELDAIYDIESETGCDFHLPAPEGKVCARRETPVPDFNRRAVMSGRVTVPSGQSILFPVNKDHLKKYLTVYVLYNYEWEQFARGSVPPRYESQHRVYFSWYDLEQGLKRSAQKPK